MKITVHRETETTTYGVIQSSGQWVMRDRQAVDGGWIAIDAPSWAAEKKPAKVNAEPLLIMIDPYQRKTEDVPMVTVRRIVTKTVPDYEADVLVRSGWELVE
jgi:hypothetical protein